VAPLFPFLFPTPLQVGSARRTVSERAAGRREADLLRRHDVAAQHVQQLPELPLASYLPHERGIRYSLATTEKGKPDFRPALCDNDSRPNSSLTHTISRDPHEKRRKLLTADDVSPLTLLPCSR
jgi:hypothetical protein